MQKIRSFINITHFHPFFTYGLKSLFVLCQRPIFKSFIWDNETRRDGNNTNFLNKELFHKKLLFLRK